MPSLAAAGSARDCLLLRLVGIEQREPSADSALLAGEDSEPARTGDDRLFVALPDPENPQRETMRLAEQLGRAVGLGRVQL